MKIIGLDSLVFGVESVPDAARFLVDYGLTPVDITASGGRFEALDGTSIEIAHQADPRLPRPPAPGCRLRATVMGVNDTDTLAQIAAELGRDREVRKLTDGSIESVDDSGFVLRFQVTVRRPFSLAGEISNAPGSPFLRPINSLGVPPLGTIIRPRTLSHVVYFVPDVLKAEAFYVNRLGFRCTDRFTGAGPFLQPGGSLDHHTHFLIGAPPHMQGAEHFTFHFGGPSEMIANGYRFAEKGYQSFWGPGRHILGSNWFWYFNSPFGCHIEMDADMDMHDAQWKPREASLGADTSQTFLMKMRPKWSPGPGTPVNGDYA
ncbi:VOC family protein [Oryzibacter oryziterrae]|uniref:VOC family protein n=1 Tax=Oryzibacter oryziterrae TaxID=2766474 RepID=UPI001F3FF55D|nr:VOC family protein [Oryzibacter oryziterrae]